jgi:hypothetical protein
VGSIGALLISIGDPYGIHVLKGSYMALDFSTPGAIFLLFIICFTSNFILKKARPKYALSPPELVTAYIMMIIASAISTMGFSSQILPILTAPFYFANQENRWDEIITPYIKHWLAPHDQRAINWFYEGMPSGASIPLSPWLLPLAMWLIFILILYFVMICMAVIVRRQWVLRERLVYPLTQLPLEMIFDEGGSFFRNKTMWIGFAIPFFVGTAIALHNYFPYIPGIRLDSHLMMFRNKLALIFRLSFPMLGFFYLVNLDIAFSLWFFNLFFFLIRGIMAVLGISWRENLGIYGTPNVIFAHLGMGAMITLVVYGLWVGREHIKGVFLKAFGRSGADDSDEIISYRVAVWGTILGITAIGIWLWFSGMPGRTIPLFLFGAFVLFLGLTRVVVESGLAEAVASTISPGFVVSSMGSKVFGQKGLVSLGLTYIWCSDIRTFVMASCAHGLKAIDMVKGERRGFFWIIALSIAISILGSLGTTLSLAYHKGGLLLNTWFFQQGPIQPYIWVSEKIMNPTGPNIGGWILRGVGAAIMAALMYLRHVFLWWPFHPLGFCVGGIWIMDQIWFTCFLAWLLKAIIMRYGGFRLYRSARPFFLGLILGQFTCNGIWLIIDFLTGHVGNQIFWI